MTVSVLGTESTTNFGVTSLVYTPTVGSYLAVYAVASGADITAVSDGTNTYTKQGSSLHDTTHGWFMALFTSNQIASATPYTIAITTAGASGALWVAEIGGSSGYQTTKGLWQAAPGTGTDAVSTGLIGTLSAQPALIHAVSFGDNGATLAPAHGTGFTAGTSSGAAFGGDASSENKRVTATTSIAATFTAPSTTSDYLTIASVWTEQATSTYTLNAASASYAITIEPATFAVGTFTPNLLAAAMAYNLSYAFASSDFNLVAARVSYAYTITQLVTPTLAAGTIFYSYIEVPAQLVSVVFPTSLIAANNSYALSVQSVTFSFVIPASGFRVRAVYPGVYGGQYYREGDVFDIAFAADYSDSTVNYQVNGNQTAYGWQIRVPSDTPLLSSNTSEYFPVSYTGVRTVM